MSHKKGKRKKNVFYQNETTLSTQQMLLRNANTGQRLTKYFSIYLTMAYIPNKENPYKSMR